MARPGDDDGRGQLAFSGEVWTDARGYATVSLPRSVGRLHGNLDYELDPSPRRATAKVASQLSDGRFTIETDEPHVKVAWRVAGRRSQSQKEER